MVVIEADQGQVLLQEGGAEGVSDALEYAERLE